MKNRDARRAWSLLLTYADALNIDIRVIPGKQGCLYYWSLNEKGQRHIDIAGTYSLSDKVYSLAHELGHHVHQSHLDSEGNMNRREKIGRVAIERYAWRAGALLLRLLNIPFNPRSYATTAAECLSGYKKMYGNSY